MLFFGFTHCGMVCPTTLAALSKMYAILQKSSSTIPLPQVIFISIDPGRDSIEELDNYINTFNTSFIAARTSTEKTILLQKDFHIIANKSESNSANSYNINHSSEIILINPNAKIQAYFAYPHSGEVLAEEYRKIYALLSKKP